MLERGPQVQRYHAAQSPRQYRRGSSTSMSYRDLSLGHEIRKLKNPNQLTGKPRAEDMVQPVSGTANSSTYSSACVKRARRRS